MKSLPPVLLNELLNEISTLASVYHKPASAFLGQGRYGADAIQNAAIQEQRQNAVDNPIAASAVTAAANGGPASNAENLLDIDFDGAAPASVDAMPQGGSSGLEGLAGTPQRQGTPADPAHGNNGGGGLDDMMGLFDANGIASPGTQVSDLMGMNGFDGLGLGPSSQPPPPQQQLDAGGNKGEDDLLGIF
jgi:AP-1 complex subunit beta-1